MLNPVYIRLLPNDSLGSMNEEVNLTMHAGCTQNAVVSPPVDGHVFEGGSFGRGTS